MGYIRHHAIVVTSWDKELIKAAHEKALSIFHGNVSNIIGPTLNSYLSFFVGPDGSKEGWADSDLGDKQRETFINWINEQAYEDKSNSLRYAELFYSDDEWQSEIVNHN